MIDGTRASASGEAAAPDAGKLKVFISYSRRDLAFADQLAAILEWQGFHVVIDRKGIHGAESWERRLGNLILESDAVVFVLSPDSAVSDICKWEVEEAARRAKRLVPILCRPLESAKPHDLLRDLNYIHFYAEPNLPGSGFGTGQVRLIDALKMDVGWLREHTRLEELAARWEASGRPIDLLVRGSELKGYQVWRAGRPTNAPDLTALQRAFLGASDSQETERASAERKRLDDMAASQSERTAALNRMEAALREAAVAQLRRVRIRNVALIAVTFIAALAAWQWYRAELRQQSASNLLNNATNVIIKISKRGAIAQDLNENVFAIFAQGVALGDTRAMANLGVVYENGYAVAQDFGRAREWYERAVQHGYVRAMVRLGNLAEQGKGQPQDFAAARQWYQKAAAQGDTVAMIRLGQLEESGFGVPENTDNARRWYEKAVASGDASGSMRLADLDVTAAMGAGKYEEAARLMDELAVSTEKAETDDLGQPGPATAIALVRQSWVSLFVRRFDVALATAQRVLKLAPDRLIAQLDTAHALMFLGRTEEALALHRANKGKRLPGYDNQLWEELTKNNFRRLRDAGVTVSAMDDVERVLSTP